MSWHASQIGDRTGRTALVTGANSGIGLVEATTLAEHGARVILACRNVEAGRAAAATMSGDVSVEQLDLASLDSVRALADRLTGPLDLLVNNAGVMAPPRHRETVDGFELQYGTNHLGHFALTGLLLPRLLQSAAPWVTTVASIAHRRGDASVVEGNPAAGYSPQKAYGNSKLANLLFALELDRRARAAGSSLVSNAAHPGVSATGLASDKEGLGAIPVVGTLAGLLLPLVVPGPTSGAEAILYAATTGDPGSYTGPQHLMESRGPVGPAKLSAWARDEDLARRLWERSEEQTGVAFAF